MSEFESNLPENISSEALEVVVPIEYLHGIKTPNEYSQTRTKSVAKGISDQGYQFLEERPILAGLVPVDHGSMIVIINGHHRSREAPNHHIFSVPTRLLSVALLSEYVQMPEEELSEKLQDWTARSMYDFDRRMSSSGKKYEPPLRLEEIFTVGELANQVEQKNAFEIYSSTYIRLLASLK